MPQQKQTHVVLLLRNQKKKKKEKDQLKQQSIMAISFLKRILFTNLSCCSQSYDIYCINVLASDNSIQNALGNVGLKHLISEVSIAIELGLEFLQNYIYSGINYLNEWVSLEKSFLFFFKSSNCTENNIYLLIQENFLFGIKELFNYLLGLQK